MNQIASDKSILRTQWIERRKCVHHRMGAQAAHALIKPLQSCKKLLQADVVLAYKALGSEISSEPLLLQLFSHRSGIQFFFPSYSLKNPERNVFHRAEVKPSRSSAQLCFNLLPEIFQLSRFRTEKKILCLVPLIAFDQKGFRLGRGAGYYDELLERVTVECAQIYASTRLRHTFVSVGLAYDEQYYEGLLPFEAHDRPLNRVLTPKKAWRFDAPLPQR